jgi:glycosyltransferase involved in cell wall biosynthesis
VRILFLNVSAALGGAERVLLDMLASLRRAAPAVELHVAVPAPGPLVERAAGLGVRVHLLPMPEQLAEMGDSALRESGRWRAALGLVHAALRGSLAAWTYAGQLRRLVAAVRPDVVHSNSIKFHLLTALARLRDVLVVWHVHDFLSRRPLMRRGLRWLSGATHGAIAISGAVGRDATAVLPRLRVAVIANGVDTERFAPGPGNGAWLDRLAGLRPASADTVRVGLVATYARWKGQDVFLEAATRVVQERVGWPLRFYVIGGPIYQTRGSQWTEEELRSRAVALTRMGAGGFVAFQEDTVAVYRALDIVVHASTQPEPFGLTIAEAMSCGRPVIVARAGGAAELFTEDHDALGVPAGDAAALAAVLQTLLADPPHRARLAANARVTAMRAFSRDRLGPELLAAYASFRAANHVQPQVGDLGRE